MLSLVPWTWESCVQLSVSRECQDALFTDRPASWLSHAQAWTSGQRWDELLLQLDEYPSPAWQVLLCRLWFGSLKILCMYVCVWERESCLSISRSGVIKVDFIAFPITIWMRLQTAGWHGTWAKGREKRRREEKVLGVGRGQSCHATPHQQM